MQESGNLYADLPPSLPDEALATLARGGRFRLERILSTGQATPDGQWYDQEMAEWVVLLRGSATLRFEHEAAVELRPGDWLLIPAHRRHRVERTDAEETTVWLALHYSNE
jgi:cupin 2 domain-containing protein